MHVFSFVRTVFVSSQTSSLILQGVAGLMLTIPPLAGAQQAAFLPATDSSSASAVTTPHAASTATLSSAAPVAARPLTARWLDLKTFSHAQRYRNAYDQGGLHLFESGQQRSLIEGRLKLDAKARYTIGFRASSGHYFNWAFADYAGASFSHQIGNPSKSVIFTPAESFAIFQAVLNDPTGLTVYGKVPSNGWNFYMRELYASATPVKPVTVEFGSFAIERGFSTEITTFDDDGYLSGERIRIHDPKHLFFDQIGYTNAFFGDVGNPNFFARGGSLTAFNYRQTFLKKQINPRMGFSADYTWQIHTNTMREAIVLGISETKIADRVRVELYQRFKPTTLQKLNIPTASGYAIAFEKKLGSRVSGDVGFADIDKDYTVYNGSRLAHAVGFSLNGDTYGLGKRPFTHASVKITPVITAFGFYTHQVGDRVINFNKQGFNAGLNFDLKALANTEKKIF